MNSPSFLLEMLLAVLAMNAIAPANSDPWDTWRSFKQYARIVDEIPDPGVSVQLFRPTDDAVDLVFVRQVLEPHQDWLSPVGGVVCELQFACDDEDGVEREAWSFDFPSFEQFVDAVEQDPDIARLLLKKPEKGRVYWLDA